MKVLEEYEKIKSDYDTVASKELDLRQLEDESVEVEDSASSNPKKRMHSQVEAVAKASEALAKRARACKAKVAGLQKDEETRNISKSLSGYDITMSSVCRIARQSIAPKVNLIDAMQDVASAEASGIRFAACFAHKIMSWKCDSRLRLGQFSDLADCFNASKMPVVRRDHAAVLLESTMCRLVRAVTPESLSEKVGPYVNLGSAMRALPPDDKMVGGGQMLNTARMLLVFSNPQECSVEELKATVDLFHDIVEITQPAPAASPLASSPEGPEASPDLGAEVDEVDAEVARPGGQHAASVMKAISGTKGGMVLLKNARGWLARREQEFGVDELVEAFATKLVAIGKEPFTMLTASNDVRDELKVLLGKEKFMIGKTKARLEKLRQLLSIK